MPQNEPQGMEAAAGQTGGTGSKTGSEGGGASAGARSTPPQTGEPGRTQTATQPGGGTGREQEGQPAGRLTRREAWDDQLSGFFGGSPFALFRRLSDDMDRLFFGGGQGMQSFGAFGLRFMPNVDVEQKDDRIVVRADLPGVKPDDFRVDIEDDALVLQGERRVEREDTKGGVRRSERSYGSFRRVIPLPQGANPEAAEARFENGVLEIDIPLQQQTRSRRLEVHTGGGTGTSTGTSSGTSSDPTRH